MRTFSLLGEGTGNTLQRHDCSFEQRVLQINTVVSGNYENTQILYAAVCKCLQVYEKRQTDRLESREKKPTSRRYTGRILGSNVVIIGANKT